VFARALDDAKKEVDGVAAHIGGLTIKVVTPDGSTPSDLRVTVDDQPVSSASLGVKRYIDPGSHVIKADATGWKHAELTVKVPDAGAVDGPVTLEKDTGGAVPPVPAQTPTPNPAQPTRQPDVPPDNGSSSGGKSILPWVAFGVGGVGLVTGVVTGVIAMGDHSSLQKNCPGGTCPPSQYSNVDGYHTMSLLSTVGFVVAGVGAAAGVTLWLLQPKTETPPATGLHVTPVVGLGSVGAIGTF
jgi:hypothetical protein